MSRSQIRGGQIKDDSITGDDVNESTLILNTLRDGDGDTKVQVEESADEDKIRFDVAGNEVARIESTGLFITGALEITPGDNSGITFHKSENEINFIRFANSSDGSSYNATLTYQVAEHLFIQPGRGADFYIQARTNVGSDPFTFPFRIMDDGTAKFEKRQSNSAISAGDLPENIALYVSGSTDGSNNALFGGNLVMSGSLSVEGGVKKSSIRDVNSSTTATGADYILRCIHTGPITITLPSKNDNAGQELIVKDALGNAGSHNITINGAGGDSIDGSPSFLLNQNRQSLTIVCDEINGWMVTGMYIP